MTDEAYSTRFTDEEIWGLDKALSFAVGDALVRLSATNYGHPVAYKEAEGHDHGWRNPCQDCSQLSATAWANDLRTHGEALLAYAGPDAFDQIYEKYKDVAPVRPIESLAEWEKIIVGLNPSEELLRDYSQYREEELEIDKARRKGAKKAFRWIAKNLESLWD